jgi:hypothetical protein
MAGRILTIQRQARELGRLRSGYTDGRRPVRSETWIVTSPAEHYVQAAAAEWGGTVEPWQPQGNGAAQFRVITQAVAVDAIMPPGDPLSQSYESWNKGGCARRCDGITELLSDTACLCRAQYGDTWYEQGKDTVCAATTRLNVILPQMPDVGVWRMETHSHWAANEIAAHVDLIRTATGGERAVPIRLRIEQRQRLAGGKTKKFPVVAVELRGVTAGQVLAGTVLGAIPSAAPPALGGETPAAIEAAGRQAMSDEQQAQVIEGLPAVGSVDELKALWKDLAREFVLSDDVKTAMTARAAELGADASPSTTADADAMWQRVLATVPPGWSTTQAEEHFEQVTGVPSAEATAEDMQRYLAVVAA